MSFQIQGYFEREYSHNRNLAMSLSRFKSFSIPKYQNVYQYQSIRKKISRAWSIRRVLYHIDHYIISPLNYHILSFLKKEFNILSNTPEWTNAFVWVERLEFFFYTSEVSTESFHNPVRDLLYWIIINLPKWGCAHI